LQINALCYINVIKKEAVHIPYTFVKQCADGSMEECGIVPNKSPMREYQQ
jgi:hypothetical protein